MRVTFQNEKHNTSAGLNIKHCGQTLSEQQIRGLNKKLCPDGCCSGMIKENGPRNKVRQAFFVIRAGILYDSCSDNRSVDVYAKRGVKATEGLPGLEDV